MFDLADFQQYLERPVDYWRDFGRRCAVPLQQKTITPFHPGEIERFAKRVLARMTAETGLQLSPERAQAFAEGMREACTKGPSSL
jgi:hypothetical protein